MGRTAMAHRRGSHSGATSREPPRGELSQGTTSLVTAQVTSKGGTLHMSRYMGLLKGTPKCDPIIGTSYMGHRH